jgi:DNA-binding transcriptional ArsR family regulator
MNTTSQYHGYFIPDYEHALAQKNRKKIVKAIAEMGGIANFSDIERNSGVKDNVLVHHLNALERLGVIDKVTKGTYRLRYKTPLCYVYEKSKQTDIVYIGLLGNRASRETPETKVALELLAGEGLKPRLVYVLTSHEALKSWANLKLPYQWIICYESEIIDIDLIKEKVRSQLESLLKDYLVVLDCTSATKPATLACYELAQQYLVPLIYVYEPIKRLKWIISRESLLNKLAQS